MGMAIILGVAWEYFQRYNQADELTESLSLFTDEADDASELKEDLSSDNTRIAADIDSSDILKQLMDEQATPPPATAPRQSAQENRENNIDRLIETLANATNNPTDAANNSDNNESSESDLLTSNLFLQSLTSDSEDNAETETEANPFSFNFSESPSSETQSQTPTNFFQFDFSEIASPRTQNLGLPRNNNAPSNNANRNSQDNAENSSNTSAEETADNGETGDGRATSAETLPAFATPPPTNLYNNPSNSTLPAFTGYPYNPNNVATPTTPNAPSPTNTPSNAGTANTGSVFDPLTSGNPTNGYRRPTYIPNANVNPYGNMPNNTLGNTNNAPTGLSGYPTTNSPGMTPQQGTTGDLQNPQMQQQSPPFSVPRTPPGRAIGNGEINTFANP